MVPSLIFTVSSHIYIHTEYIAASHARKKGKRKYIKTSKSLLIIIQAFSTKSPWKGDTYSHAGHPCVYIKNVTRKA
jgi:hypothetical protein